MNSINKMLKQCNDLSLKSNAWRKGSASHLAQVCTRFLAQGCTKPLAQVCTVLLLLGMGLLPPTARAQEGGIEYTVKSGVGYNSNIYKVDTEPFIDYAALDPFAPPLPALQYFQRTPTVESGFFVPLEFKAEYKGSQNNFRQFVAAYRLDSETYLNGDYRNADNSLHKISAGMAKTSPRQDNPLSEFYYGAFLSQKKQNYLNGYDGANKTNLAGQDVSKRYHYQGLGIEGEYKGYASVFEYTLGGVYESRDYASITSPSEYDNVSLKFMGDLGMDIGEDTKVTLKVTDTDVRYSDRPSYNLTGSVFPSHPRLHYHYFETDLILRQDFSKAWRVFLDYNQKTREDLWVGYNSYTRGRIRGRVLYRPSDDLRVRLDLRRWKREYPNAFAYENKVAPKKFYEGGSVKLKADWNLDKSRTLSSEVHRTVQHSTDKRDEYVRDVVMASLEWRF